MSGFHLGWINISEDIKSVYIAGTVLVFVTLIVTYIANIFKVKNVWVKRFILMFGPIVWVPLFTTVLYYIITG